MWSYNLQQSQVSTERHSLAVATINTAHSLPLNNVSQSLSTSFYPSYVSNAWFILVVVLSLSCYKHLGDRRQILRIGHGQIFPLWGRYPGAPKSEILALNVDHLPANISKTVTCQLELNEGFLKCKSQGGSPPPREFPPPVWPVCALLTHLLKRFS